MKKTTLKITMLFISFFLTIPSTYSQVIGATTPFKIYEAENGTLTNGATLLTQSGIPTAPTVEFESSGRKCVQLDATNESISWTTTAISNAIVIRVCIPDAPGGGGINATLNLYVDGIFRQAISTTSKYAWTYGTVSEGMSDDNPASGTPKRFFESSRALITGSAIAPGSIITLKKDAANTASYYKIDLITLENVGPALTQPANTLSIVTYGAIPNDGTDDSTAFKNCITACQSQGKGMWIPAGEFHTQGIITATGISIYGAGMWYSQNTRLYGASGYRHKWNLNDCNVQDLYIFNPETGRELSMGHDYGMTCQGTTGYTIQRVWIQHGGACFWLSGTDGTIKDCRAIESWADGINLNNSGSIQTNYAGLRLTAQNNFIIGSGDDGIALNAQNGGGTTSNMVDTKILNNTSIGVMWGNGMRIAGGRNTILKDNLITDPTSSNGIRVGKFGTTGNPCESVLVTGNTILRGCGLRPIYGQGGICVADGVTATIENNTINDSGGLGIDVQSSTATFTSNKIDNAAMNGFLVKSGASGSGTFLNNIVSNINSGQVAFQNDAISSYTTTLNGNSWQTINVTSVTLTPATATISVGNTQQLTATIAPSNATNNAVTWSTNNATVATVNASGLVTAVASGTATITVTTQDGAKTDTSVITVSTASNVMQNLQAEDATYSGAILASDQTGYKGTGFIDFVNNTGDYIQWTVNVPTAGTYELSFRYALPNGGRPLELKVNNTVKIASMDFPATGLWNTWLKVSTSQTLNAGNNTIRITSIGSNGGNIDMLSVSPYLDTCDALSTWVSAGANTLSYTTSDKKQGTGSIQMIGSATEEFKKVFSPAFNSGTTISNGILTFWYFVSDVTKCGTVRIELGSGGAADVNELSWPLTGLVNGWNQISLNFSDASQIGTPNLNALNWFRIYDTKSASITTRIDAIQVLNSATVASSQRIGKKENKVTEVIPSSEGKSVTIYPNPYKDGTLSLDILGFESSNEVQLKITNLLGQVIHQEILTDKTHKELNLSGSLNESVYFISLEAGENKVVKKLIVK